MERIEDLVKRKASSLSWRSFGLTWTSRVETRIHCGLGFLLYFLPTKK